MKQAITPAYTFTPSSLANTSTLNLSGVSGFNVALLYAVINQTHNTIIYAAGAAGFGYASVSSTTITLAAALPGQASTDSLLIIYDVGTPLPAGAAQDGTDATGVTAPTGGIGIRGWLSGIYQKLSGSLAVTGTFWQATQPVSLAALPLPAGAATAALQPAINGDGGALAHVTNFPASFAISGTPTVTDPNNLAFQGVAEIVPGTNQTAQRSVGVNCTVAGNVSFLMADSSTLVVPVFPGWQTFPFAVQTVNVSGTTATATYYNLK